ncbi:MAG: acyclic terpene utilization AtuA family protein [Roseovarius sp.]|nr:acyclic terpene utilization AtuA family protein [Roseovarius sp.]
MVRVLVPSGALGLNYDAEALERGIAQCPDVIAIDGGSTDSGPSYLGRGLSKYARSSTKTEWAGLMAARAKAGCPLIIGSAGTCGTDSAVDWLLEITREIVSERGESVKVAMLRSSQDSAKIARAWDAGRITALANAPSVDAARIASCTNIVALAGVEQVNLALATGADIVICGRTTDSALIAALPIARGVPAGYSWHGGKIAECGALCTTNPQSGVVIVEFDAGGFTVIPMSDTAQATPQTVSAHMLYENSNPNILFEPGGHLDVTQAVYSACDERSVRVTGSRWVDAEPYAVKLEGARAAGFQTVTMALLRDPRYVAQASEWAEDIEAKCREKACSRLSLSLDEFSLEIRLIGHSATFGALESQSGHPVEIGAVGIVTAETEALAGEIGKLLNPYMLHHPLTENEELPTFAFPFSPPEMHRGEIYEFVLNHVLHLEDPMDAFRLEVQEVG